MTPDQDEIITTTEPDLENLEASTALVVSQAEAIVISNDVDYEAAGLFLREEVKQMLEAIAETFDPIVAAAHATHKEAVAQRKRHQEPLLEAEQIVKRSMSAYYREQEIAREAAAQEAREAARLAEEDRKVEEAARLERDGRQDAADDRLRQPVAPIVAAPAPAPPQAAGVSVRKVWKWRAIGDGSGIKPAFRKIDEAKIGKAVRAMGKDAEDLVGGIEAYQEISTAARS